MSGVLLDEATLRPGVKHGIGATYKHGCRCEPCKAAQRVSYAAYYRERSPRNPTLRKTAPRRSLKRATDVYPRRP